MVLLYLNGMAVQPLTTNPNLEQGVLDTQTPLVAAEIRTKELSEVLISHSSKDYPWSDPDQRTRILDYSFSIFLHLTCSRVLEYGTEVTFVLLTQASQVRISAFTKIIFKIGECSIE